MGIVVPFVRRDRSEPEGGDLVSCGRAVFAMVGERVGLSGSAMRVGHHLLSLFDRDTGACTASAASIARTLGLCPHTVYRSISQLEATGLVLRHSPFELGWPTPYEIFWRRIVDIHSGAPCPTVDPDFLREHASKLRREATLEERFRLQEAGLRGATGGGQETFGRWLGDGWVEGQPESRPSAGA
jgi:hypothetical protein